MRSSSSLQAAALLAPRLGPRVLLLALQLDPVAVGEQLDRLGEAQPLLLLDELDRVAADPAAEAVVELFLRRRPRTRACAPRGRGRARPSARPGGAGRCGRRSTSTMSTACLTRSRLSVGDQRHQKRASSGTVSSAKLGDAVAVGHPGQVVGDALAVARPRLALGHLARGAPCSGRRAPRIVAVRPARARRAPPARGRRGRT